MRERWSECAARVAAGKFSGRFAGIRGKGGDEDQCLDVLVAVNRIADHRTAVRVADQQDGALNALEYAGDICAVAPYAAQRIGSCDHRVTFRDQSGQYATPAGGLGERAVDKNDGRLAVFSACRIHGGCQ